MSQVKKLIKPIVKSSSQYLLNVCHFLNTVVFLTYLIDYAKAFHCVDHNKLKNSERYGNTRPPDLPPECLYAAQEATVGTGHGTADYFQIEKGVRQGCILSYCLFNLYAEYIMRNAGLDEA